ncbi:leucine-rich repeat protein, partial [Clostridiaceae bacterium OttesenSCG-928-D20]|nr:leucine-rich repeat protein [Clostridiaceae bacterium OttesenSCG-928-D20]
EVTGFGNVTTIADWAFASCTTLSTLDTSGVTSIGDSAFLNAKAINPDLSSVVSIGNNAFSGCESIELNNNFLPSNIETIGSKAFNNCAKIESVIIASDTALTSVQADSFGSAQVYYFPLPDEKTGIKQESWKPLTLTIEHYMYYAPGGGAEPSATLMSNKTQSITDFSGYSDYTNITAVPDAELEAMSTGVNNAVSTLTGNILSTPNLVLKVYYNADISNFWVVNFNTLGGNAEEYTRLIPKGTLEEPAIIGELPTASKLNATFAGWLYDQNDGATTVSADDEITGDTTIYAKWVEGWKVGENVWAKLESNGTLRFEVVGEGDGVLYTAGETVDDEVYAYPWAAHIQSVKAIVMDEGVVNVPAGAFQNYAAIISAVIPSVTNIGSGAFFNCANLSSIDLTNIETLGNGAFANTAITNVVMPKVTEIAESTFQDCASLLTVDLPNVTEIGEHAFARTTALTTIEFSNVETLGEFSFRGSGILHVEIPKVTVIEQGVFQMCKRLLTVDMPNVTEIKREPFAGCDVLLSAYMPKVVTIGSGAFNSCLKLNDVEIPSAIMMDSGAFGWCMGLETIKMPKVQIVGGSAFHNCPKLKEINFIEMDMARTAEQNLADFGIELASGVDPSAFEECTAVTTLNMPNTTIFATEEGFIYNEGIKYTGFRSFAHELKGLKTVLLPKAKTIGNYAFYGLFDKADGSADQFWKLLGSISTINIDEAVIIGDYAFSSCRVRDLVLPNVEIIGEYGFNSCSAYTVSLPKVKEIKASGFRSSIFIKTVYFPELETLGDAAFLNYSSGYIVGIDAPKLTSMGDRAFQNQTSLEEINIPVLESMGALAFSGCTSLKTIDAPQVTTIGTQVFYKCEGLTSANFPLATYIPDTIFSLCTNLKTASFPLATSIGKSAFRSCTNLNSVEVPLAQTVEAYAFSDCTNLTELNFLEMDHGTGGYISEVAFYSTAGVKVLNMPKTTKLVTKGHDREVPFNKFVYYIKGTLETVNIPCVTEIDNSFFSGFTSLKTVNMDAVQKIGKSAFFLCRNLTEINLLEMDMGAEENPGEIAEDAFNLCSGVNKLNMPKTTAITNKFANKLTNLADLSIPKVKTIAESAFESCAKLQNLDLSEVIEIGAKAFAKASKNTAKDVVETIHMPKVQIIGANAFKNWANLQEINLTEMDMGAETNPGSIEDDSFYGCTNVTKLNMPETTAITSPFAQWLTNLRDVNIPKAETICANAFKSLKELETVNMDAVDTIGDYAFYNCKIIAEINMPAARTIGNFAFRDCTALVDVNMPAVKTIGNYAFDKCTSLTELNFVELDMGNGDSIAYNAFSGCIGVKKLNMLATTKITNKFATQLANLEEVNLPIVTEICKNGFSDITVVPSKFLTKLKIVNMPAVEIIGGRAFQGGASLAEVNMPAVQTIGECAFQSCTSLAEANMPVVKTIGDSAFDNCTSLAEIRMDTVISIDKFAFRGCAALTEINLIEIDTGVDPFVNKISEYAFEGCTGVKKLNMPSTTTISTAFPNRLVNLVEANLSEVTMIGTDAFKGLTSLSTVTMPLVEDIRDGAFSGCGSLPEAIIPKATTIGESAFENCYDISRVDVRGAATIGEKAFSGCELLDFAILPETLTTISTDSFHENTRIYYFPNRPPEIMSDDTKLDVYSGWLPINIGARHYAIFNVENPETGAMTERIVKIGESSYDDVYFDQPIVTVTLLEKEGYTYSQEETEKRGSAVFTFNVLENPAAKSELYYIPDADIEPPVAPYRLYMTWKGGVGGLVSASGNANNGYDDVPLLDTFEITHTTKGEKSAIATLNFQYIELEEVPVDGMEIRLPVNAYANRTSGYMYRFDVSNDMMPKKASECTQTQPFYWTIDAKTKEIVLKNGLVLKKNHSARIELRYTYDPWLVSDGETSSFYATGSLKKLVGENYEYSEIISNVLYAKINTKISGPTVDLPSAKSYTAWDKSWGEQPEELNSEDYFFVKWNYTVDHKFGAQPFEHEVYVMENGTKLAIGEACSNGGILASFDGNTESAEKSGVCGESKIKLNSESGSGYVIMAYPKEYYYDSTFNPSLTIKSEHTGMDDETQKKASSKTKNYLDFNVKYEYGGGGGTDATGAYKSSSGGLSFVGNYIDDMTEVALGKFTAGGRAPTQALSGYGTKKIKFSLVDDLLFIDGVRMEQGDFEFTYLDFSFDKLTIKDIVKVTGDDGKTTTKTTTRTNAEKPPVSFYYKDEAGGDWKLLETLTESKRLELPKGTYAVKAHFEDAVSYTDLQYDLGFKLFLDAELKKTTLEKANAVRIVNINTIHVEDENGKKFDIPSESSYKLDQNVQSQVKAHDLAVYGNYCKHDAASLLLYNVKGKSEANKTTRTSKIESGYVTTTNTLTIYETLDKFEDQSMEDIEEHLNVQTTGTFYDLLPKHTSPDFSTVEVVTYSTNKAVIAKKPVLVENWQGTGRTMMIVEVAYTQSAPNIEVLQSGSVSGFVLKYDAVTDLSFFSPAELRKGSYAFTNSFAYRTTSKNADGTAGKLFYGTEASNSTISDKAYFADLKEPYGENDDENNNTVYAESKGNIQLTLATHTGNYKLVKGQDDPFYAENTVVPVGGSYTYSLNLSAPAMKDVMWDVVIYDILEKDITKHQNDQKSEWYGVIESIDLSYDGAETGKTRVAPVAYYTTLPIAQLGGLKTNEGENSTRDLTNDAVWTKWEEDLPLETRKDITAIAIDLRYSDDKGTPYVFDIEERFSAFVKMRAPRDKQYLDKFTYNTYYMSRRMGVEYSELSENYNYDACNETSVTLKEQEIPNNATLEKLVKAKNDSSWRTSTAVLPSSEYSYSLNVKAPVAFDVMWDAVIYDVLEYDIEEDSEAQKSEWLGTIKEIILDYDGRKDGSKTKVEPVAYYSTVAPAALKPLYLGYDNPAYVNVLNTDVWLPWDGITELEKADVTAIAIDLSFDENGDPYVFDMQEEFKAQVTRTSPSEAELYNTYTYNNFYFGHRQGEEYSTLDYYEDFSRSNETDVRLREAGEEERSTFDKYVKGDADASYKRSTEVPMGGGYSYSLDIKAPEQNLKMWDAVVYDVLEYDLEKHIADEAQKSEWEGFIENISFTGAGLSKPDGSKLTPKAYYTTKAIDDIDGIDTEAMDLSDGTIWTLWDTAAIPDEATRKEITAIAVDLSLNDVGGLYEFDTNEAFSVIVQMSAPMDSSLSGKKTYNHFYFGRTVGETAANPTEGTETYSKGEDVDVIIRDRKTGETPTVNKAVKGEGDPTYKTSTIVPLASGYSYQLKAKAPTATYKMWNTVIFDVLEQDVTQTTQKSKWQGSLESMTLGSTAGHKGSDEVAPKLYYTTKSLAELAGLKPGAADASIKDLTDDTVWTEWDGENVKDGDDKASITAIAIDLSTNTDGEPYVFDIGEQYTSEVFMTSSRDSDDVGKKTYNEFYMDSDLGAGYSAINFEDGYIKSNETEVGLRNNNIELHKFSDPDGTSEKPRSMRYGKSLTYELTVTSKETLAAMKNVLINDDIPEGLDIKFDAIQVKRGLEGTYVDISTVTGITLSYRDAVRTGAYNASGTETRFLSFMIDSLEPGETVFFKIPTTLISEEAEREESFINTAFIDEINRRDVEIQSETKKHVAGVGKLSIAKTVPYGSYAKEFEFEVIIRDDDGRLVDADYDYKKNDGSTGTINPKTSETRIIRLTHGETAVIENIEAGFSYEVREIPDSEYSVNSQSYRGSIQKDSTVSLTFENTFKLDPVKTNFELKKKLEGSKPFNAGDFEFTADLVSGNRAHVSGAYNLTAKNLAPVGEAKEAAVKFASITFTRAGIFVYELKETKGSEKYVEYDGKKIYAEVIVGGTKEEEVINDTTHIYYSDLVLDSVKYYSSFNSETGECSDEITETPVTFTNVYEPLPEIHKESDPATGTEAEPKLIQSRGDSLNYTLTILNKDEHLTLTNILVEDEIPLGLVIDRANIECKTPGVTITVKPVYSGAEVVFNGGNEEEYIEYLRKLQMVEFTITKLDPEQSCEIFIPTTVTEDEYDENVYFENTSYIREYNEKKDLEIQSEITYHKLDENYGYLRIGKTLVGGENGPAEAFSFKIEITKPDGSDYLDENNEKVKFRYFYSYVTDNPRGMIVSGDTLDVPPGETVRLTKLPVGAKYKITEVQSQGYIGAGVNTTGTIQRNKTALVSFVNSYEGDSDEYSFKASKKLVENGSIDEIGEREFTFHLELINRIIDGDVQVGEAIKGVTMPAASSVKNSVEEISFDSVKFKDKGVYYFKIYEDNTAPLPNIVNDPMIKYFEVTVENVSSAVYITKVRTAESTVNYTAPFSSGVISGWTTEYTKEALLNPDDTINEVINVPNYETEFTNTIAQPGSVTIAFTKELPKRTLTNGLFQFKGELTKLTGSDIAHFGKVDISAESLSDGTITFDPIEISQPGQYKIKVWEDDSAPEIGIIYDTTPKYVFLTATVVGNKISVTPYYANTDLSLEALPISQAKLIQANLKAETAFKNSPEPGTTKIRFNGIKTLDNKELEEGQFSFTVEANLFVPADASGPWLNQEIADNDYINYVSRDALNDENGKIDFGEFVLKGEGTYYFRIFENIPEERDIQISYTETKHYVKVVTSIEEGDLIITDPSTFSTDELFDDDAGLLAKFEDADWTRVTQATEYGFTNIYEDAASIQFKALKTLIAKRELTAKEFEFKLELKNPEDADRVKMGETGTETSITVTNNLLTDGDGMNVIFPVIGLREVADDYVFILTETGIAKVVDSEEVFVMDESQYEITVSVTQDPVTKVKTAEITGIKKISKNGTETELNLEDEIVEFKNYINVTGRLPGVGGEGLLKTLLLNCLLILLAGGGLILLNMDYLKRKFKKTYSPFK